MTSARTPRAALAALLGAAFGIVAPAQTPPAITDAKGYYSDAGCTQPGQKACATAPDLGYVTAGMQDFTLLVTGTGLSGVAAGTRIVWIPSGATCPAGCTEIPAAVVGNQAQADIPASLIQNADSGSRVAVAYGQTYSNSLPFPVFPAFQFASSALPAATLGVPYSTTLVSGGAPPYYYSFVEIIGFPPGLTGDDTGKLTGTPTTVGTFPIDAYIGDLWYSVYAPFNLTVAAGSGISFTPIALGDGIAGQAYSESLTGIGGTAPYTFTLASGTLPGGLSLASNGVFSGTPTAAGTSSFQVRVTDAVQATTTKPLTILIAPTFTPATLPNGQVGQSYSQALTGSGGTAPYTFRLVGSALPAGLTLSQTGTISGTPTALGTSTFQVEVRDAAQRVGTQTRSITIGPTPGFTPATLPAGQVGTAYTQSLTGTNGTAPYTFSASGTLPPGVTLSSGGAFSGTPSSAGTFSFQVQVQDANQSTGSADVSIAIAAAPVVLGFTPATLPNGQVGTAYSQTFSGTGGKAPYSFRVTAGALPAGLTLASGGLLSGTPTAVGTSNFTVQVEDASDATASRQLSLTIGAIPVTVGFTPATVPPGQVGTAFTRTFTGTGGTAPYTFTLNGGALPAGLTLSSSGTLSGAPQQSGAFVVNILVKDAAGNTGFANLTIVILGALQIVNTALPPAVPLQAYAAQFQAVGGQPPYVWTLSSGAPPSGLVLNGALGILSGTPDGESSGAFSITVRDSLGSITTRSFTVTVLAPAPALLSTDLPAATVALPYNFTLIAGGGTGALQYALATGALPAGLSLSLTGTLTGTPTAVGDYIFGVRVTDSLGRTGGGDVRLAVKPPALAISSGPLPVTPGGAVSITFTAAGGTPPYVWTVGSGTLPPGLSLSTGGVLSGRTETAGTYDFQIIVTDSKRVANARTFTLQLTEPPLRVSTASAPAGEVGTAYTARLAAEGGKPPYQWSATGLPPGVTVDSASGEIRGTPSQDGVFRVTVRVTDSRGQAVSADFNLAMAPPPLSILGRPLPAATAGVAYSAAFAASGGVRPYNWLVSAGSAPGLVLSSGGVIAGVPATRGEYLLTIVVSDARGTTVRSDFTLTVQVRPLAITTATLPGGVTGQRYSQALAALGGTPPYTWSGSLPAGLTIDPATGAIGGIPTATGAGTVTVTVLDAAGVSTTSTFQVSFALPPLPPLTIAGPPDVANPVGQSPVQLRLGATFPVPVTGTLTLTFTADSGADDATVQFSTGGRTAPFTIPANSLDAVFTTQGLGLQNGTVAGVITLTARLQAAGADVTPNPPPTRQVRISPGPPVIASVRAVRTAAGIEVQVTGYSSTRELTQGVFRFTAAAGSPLQTTDFTIPVDGLFSTWYASATSTTFGSQFTFTQPFTVQGPAAGIQSVAVTLSNRLGASAAATASLQ